MKSLISLKSLAAFAFAAALLASCSSQDADEVAGSDIIRFATTSISVEPQTRATIANSFEGGDIVRVNVNGTTHRFVAAADGTLTPDPAIYWQDENNVITASAWYPAADYSFSANQSAGIQSADFIFAAEVTGITRSNYASKTLAFTHRTAKINTVLVAGAGVTGTELSTATVALYGFTAAAAIDTVATTPTGNITGSGLGWITPYSSAAANFVALLLPRAYTSETLIKITLGASDYCYIPTSLTLEAGKQYTFTVTVNKSGITVNSTISDWTDGGTLTDDLFSVDYATFDLGVVIDGIKWATRNVDAPGTFAASPESKGMLYQWNRKVGWSSSGALINSNGESTWDPTSPVGNEWTANNDPCPAGWRVPTIAELESLVNSGSEWTTKSGVDGRVFGSGSNTLFLPAAGYRSSLSGTLYSASTSGYWSGTKNGSSNADILTFHSGRAYRDYFGCDHGYSVRCVADDTRFSVGGVSFKMVPVEGGTFTMGATAEQESDYNADELPTHSVTLSNFAIGQTEVTQALWLAVMGAHKSTQDYGSGDNYPEYAVSWNDIVGTTGSIGYTVNGIDYKTDGFCYKLSQLVGGGKQFCLPTEAQWEYAARGGNRSTGLYKYSGSNTIGDVAWYRGNSGSVSHEVATKQANELGIYDMSGNVAEWCSDWYGTYSNAAQTNPTGAAPDIYRVCRGGYCSRFANYCRVSSRNYLSPSSRSYYSGFRLALSE